MGVGKGTPRNPRHEAKLTAESVVNNARGQVEVSDRVLARRLIDALEPMFKAAYEQGCADGQEGSDANFNRWYVNRVETEQDREPTQREELLASLLGSGMVDRYYADVIIDQLIAPVVWEIGDAVFDCGDLAQTMAELGWQPILDRIERE